MTRKLSDTLTNLDRIRHATLTLNPTALRQRIDHWRRGGYPSTSIPTGRGRLAEDGAPPAPIDDHGNGDDPIDRWLAVRWDTVERNLRLAAQHLEAALRSQNAVLVDLDPDDAARLAADQAGPTTTECANPNCRRLIAHTATDPVRAGRCNACATWKYRHGTERPTAEHDHDVR